MSTTSGKKRNAVAAPTVDVLQGCALQELAKLRPGSVAVTVTSPPYYRQKDYHAEGQIGWESSVEAYVQQMKAVLMGVWKATQPTGSCFVVVGDTYVKKALQLVPARIAIAAAEIGWTLRNDLIWAKSDAAPDGASDRWRFTHEHILFMTKQARGYKFKADAIRVPYSPVTLRRWSAGQVYGGNKAQVEAGPQGQRFKRGKSFRLHPLGTMPRDVVECSTARSPLDHFATFPLALIERMVLATTEPSDLVLDPFAGTATTGVAALRHHRSFVGIELNREYTKIARRRLAAECTNRVAGCAA